MPDPAPPPAQHPLRELAALFLKLGATAFGGPAAHIALFEDEVVRRRKWITHQEFLDLLAATNFIPGPNSTEMAIHIGYIRGGWRGLIVAGACFIIPAAVMVTAIAWAYVTYKHLPVTTGMLYGIEPVVIAIIAQALWRMGKSVIKTWIMGLLALAAAVANFVWGHELIVLAAAGALVVLARSASTRKAAASGLLFPLGQTAPFAAAASAIVPVTLGTLFLTFLKIGSVLFGSGYVLLAFLRADFVDRLGWLTEEQLINAVSVGQVTPGPLFTTATFIGYVMFAPQGIGPGLAGAGLATLGIFLPAFVFVALSSWLIPRMRKSPAAAAFLDGLNVASLALMAVVLVRLAQTALTEAHRPDPLAIAIAVATALLLWRKANATWLVLGGAAIGAAAVLWRN